MSRTAIMVMAALMLLVGCGREERAEAVRLSQVLAGQEAVYEKAHSMERELVDNARAWCALIAANGAGKGDELDRNAAVADALAKAAAEASAQLGVIRQAVGDERLTKEYLQGVRSELITQLTSRQRALQELRALLDEAAPQFRQYRTSKTYAGDSYPGEIAKLDSLLSSYRVPVNALEAAREALRTNYDLTE